MDRLASAQGIETRARDPRRMRLICFSIAWTEGVGVGWPGVCVARAKGVALPVESPRCMGDTAALLACVRGTEGSCLPDELPSP